MKIEQLQEAGLARIKEKMDQHATGIISAFRGNLPFSKNIERHIELKQKLLNKGYHVITVKGSYIEHYGTDEAREISEKSLFVVNPEHGDDSGQLENDLIMFGNYYDQDAILSKRYGEIAFLIGTSKRTNAFPSYGKSIPIGSPKLGKANQFFSRIKNRPFTFE